MSTRGLLEQKSLIAFSVSDHNIRKCKFERHDHSLENIEDANVHFSISAVDLDDVNYVAPVERDADGAPAVIYAFERATVRTFSCCMHIANEH